MKIMMKTLVGYFALVGVLTHLGGALGYLAFPDRVSEIYWKVNFKLSSYFNQLSGELPDSAETIDIFEAIKSNFESWKPAYREGQAGPGEIVIGDRHYKTLKSAVNALKDGDVLSLGTGLYDKGIVIKENNVQLIGNGHVVFEGASINGKASIITKGNNITISNIECRAVSVADGNGACVRHEGLGLTLDSVYFHDSEQGLLSGKKKGDDQIVVTKSRFENLGNQGSAHGIYVDDGSLKIVDSLFLSSRREGHEIKSRAQRTHITRSVIASLGGRDSRLIDIPNGGRVLIEKSVLEQGPVSSNMDMIGYGLEGAKHKNNQFVLEGNTIILERNRGNRLLHSARGMPAPVASNNIIISSTKTTLDGNNYFFKDREEIGMKAYPFLPPIPE